jgi:hypothetical protein
MKTCMPCVDASLQVEKSVRVRPEVPTPTLNSLPLPPATSPVSTPHQGPGSALHQVLGWEPTWQDLPWPQGVPQLAQVCVWGAQRTEMSQQAPLLTSDFPQHLTDRGLCRTPCAGSTRV